MLVVLPFHSGDREQAVRLANWMHELGGVSAHDCLLAHDEHAAVDGIIEPLTEAFRNVTKLRITNVPKADWSSGGGDARACNEMWIQTANYMDMKRNVSWLWCEPDCCPERSTWLDELEAGYRAGGKPFMGARVISSRAERMSGIAIYPAHVCKYSAAAVMAVKVPWDLAGAADFAKHCTYTPLIQHVLRTSRESPTFPDAAALAVLQPGAALFHPCKDGTLIDRLRETRGCNPAPAVEPPKTTAVYVEMLKNGGLASSPAKPEPAAETTWIGDIRQRVTALAARADTPTRRRQIYDELREVRLIGDAIKRKRKKSRA